MTLYLKYRPKDFESLVGQEFIKNTLREAIKKEKLVGAYLFCWPRGTGKTSTARIFAKAINCTALQDGNPCGECEICQWMQNESLVDIIEIDAASYTGVDNIREIIEKAVFSPTKCKYKVYIIDEVHMLSKWAFNALLKILEEPPTHLKFILATTESHKIPETILSRCQRYDFKSITSDDLEKRLQFIASKEGIKIDNESMTFIIKQANWWLRNAISLFEQLIYNDEIIFENVIKNYGIPTTQIIEKFYQKLVSQDMTLLWDYEDIVGNYNLTLFFKELLFFIKDSLVEHIENDKIVKKHIFLLETLEESYIKSKNSFDQKTTFLVGIIKCVKNATLIEQTQDIIPTNNTPQKENKIPVENKNNSIEKKEEISHDDIFDVFGDTLPLIPTQSKGKASDNEVGGVTSWKFNIETLITELKKIWAKWALTMSLRWSTFQFDGKQLIIYTKTKISLKQIATSDNTALITSALQNIWFLDINIEVK